MDESGAPLRLREAGVGVVFGGIVLILASLGLDAFTGAAMTVLIGIAYAFLGPDMGERRRIGLGVVLVGLIGLVESSRFGLGFEPLVIGFFAIALGLFDIFIGLVFSRIRYRQERKE